jgi:hypothetical protein
MTFGSYKTPYFLILFLVMAYPLNQYFSTSGLVFYTNGWDEASYLQYDYAKHIVEISSGGRLSEYLVILLHDFGFSGGMINLLFDVITTSSLLLMLPRIFSLAGMDDNRSKLATISLLGLPLIFSNFNPIYDFAQNFVMRSEAIKWITMPFIKDPFWLRTPEPQLSILFLLFGSYLALKFKKFYLLLPLTALTYPFILIPSLFTALVYLFRGIFKFSIIASAFVSASSISLSLLFYRLFFLPASVEGYIVPTSLPLLSICGIFAFAVLVFSRKRDSALAIVLLLSIWFAANFQIVSSFTIQPNNFEQYWSAAALSLIIILQLKDLRALQVCARISMCLLFIWGFNSMATNYIYSKQIPKETEIVNDIKNDASIVALPDIYLSTRLDMLFPKQKPLLFSYTRFYKEFPERYIGDFICAEEKLKNDERYKKTLEEAWLIFQNGDQNYIMNTILRTVHPLPSSDLFIRAKGNCEEIKIY